ncbi:MAG: amidohydrolase [Lachnospiraceae bacterium]|nr:amidohydrolase [Lachnospiraceae bacterium]
MVIKLENIKALMYEEGKAVIRDADIYIKDDRIFKIDTTLKAQDAPKADKVIDGKDRLAIPGLINAHTHAYMTMFRNIADDVPFTAWLFDTIEPLEDAMTPEESYYGTLLANMEMIRTGTTSYVDMYIYPDVNARAAKESGLRACFTRGIVGSEYNDEGGMRRVNEALHDLETWCDGDLRFAMLGPHAPYSCSGDFLKHVVEIAKERGLGLNMHVAEGQTEVNMCREKYNMTPVEYVDSMGVFDVHSIAAHCVYLEDGDYDILKAKNVNVAINPFSNAKLANGFSPVPKMLDAGLNICIGTDGAASNNTLNMFREMTFEAMIHKGLLKEATAVSAEDVIRFATLGGAAALGRAGELGELREGYKADIAIIDLKVPQLQPNNNLISALIYSANGSEVDTVIVNGKILMEHKVLTTIDEERVYFEMKKIGERYMEIIRQKKAGK